MRSHQEVYRLPARYDCDDGEKLPKNSARHARRYQPGVAAGCTHTQYSILLATLRRVSCVINSNWWILLD